MRVRERRDDGEASGGRARPGALKRRTRCPATTARAASGDPRSGPRPAAGGLTSILLALVLLASGCSVQLLRVEVCDHLYFGTARVDAPAVTDEEWQRFVDDEIAPRFPDGFTISDAQGQWRTRDGIVQRERTHALLIVHPDGSGEGEIAAIVAAYKKRFAQEAVLRTRDQCSVSF